MSVICSTMQWRICGIIANVTVINKASTFHFRSTESSQSRMFSHLIFDHTKMEWKASSMVQSILRLLHRVPLAQVSGIVD